MPCMTKNPEIPLSKTVRVPVALEPRDYADLQAWRAEVVTVLGRPVTNVELMRALLRLAVRDESVSSRVEASLR